MDSRIRSLLIAAQKIGGHGENTALQQAYNLLRNVAENLPSIDSPEAFSQDLYVLCAEIAFQNGLFDMSKECLKMYFMKPPPANQFLCRAYLCQAQLLAPTATIPEQLEKAVVYLVKAIAFAKVNKRYHFLVYNASLIYWQFCRPFLKQNFKQFLAVSLHAVVKALDDVDDRDYEWRAQLMIELIECNLDARKKIEASSIASAAAIFIKQHVPHLYKKVFGLCVRNQLIDSSKLHKDIKTSAELAIYYQICKLKVSLANQEPKEYYDEIQKLLTGMGVQHIEAASKKKSKARDTSPDTPSDADGSFSRESSGISYLTISTARKLKSGTSKGILSDNCSNSSRARSPAVRGPSREHSLTAMSRLRQLSTNNNSQKHKDRGQKRPAPKQQTSTTTGKRTPTPVSSKTIAADSKDKPHLLLELARLCLDLDFPDLAQDAAEHMKTCSIKEAGFYMELEFLQCNIMVKALADKQESLQKSVVDTRMQAIKRCAEAILNSVRLNDPNVIQAGCATQWNLCLPLLQPNLRQHVRKPLTQVAEALENIQSSLVQLRCEVHTELAKCEEDVEQIEVAMTNLKKALELDDAKIYQERLEVQLHKLELRSELYKQPEEAEDIAGMIIEQARKANSGTMRMKRSLLVKAGEALAPDAFSLVLDSESDTKDVTGGKAPLTQIKKMSNKARQFNKCVKKAIGHLQRLGNENDRVRARLWGDLAKTARKQEVWDVCRVAARFCLLYDDNRWKNVTTEKIIETPSKPSERGGTKADSSHDNSGGSSDRKGTDLTTDSRPTTPCLLTSLFDKDLLRMFAEVNFIQGEAMVHLLRSEGVQLNDMPIPPKDKRKHPKGYIAKKPEEDPDWIEYCEWIKSLSECATHSFLRGLELGVELEEAWLACCAATYVWNYNNHVLTQLRHREIMPTLTTIFNGLKKTGHANETNSVVNICNALAYALMKPWIPVPNKEPTPPPTPVALTPKGKPDKPQKTVGKQTVAISNEAMPDLKKAIEVCEHVLEVTNGNNSQDVVPILIRTPILQTWVFAKQMAQQQISKNFGLDEEPFTVGQRAMSRAIVATEMLKLNKNNIMDFKEVPSIAEVASMVEECKWTDKFVELQLWTQLTSLAYDQKQHALVLRCSKKALRFASSGTQPKNKKIDGHMQMVENEMLGFSSCLLGQSLVDNMAGKNAIRREALSAFLDSARFAMKADNYEMVMRAARHYWNACCSLVSQPIERELLREPIRLILQCITETADSRKKKEEKKEESDDTEDKGDNKEAALVGDVKPKDENKDMGKIGAVEDDLTLRAALYGVLFQSYVDKEQWEDGLACMDQAVTDMPRTKHRLLIFKHRVMTKAKLGRSVAMDIQKFKKEMHYLRSRASRGPKKIEDESEDYVAHMWRRVALMSKETAEQLLSYQNAIEALNSQSNEWLKVELLQEFAQWLCVKDFPLEDCTDQINWAIDIMLNMQTDIDTKKEQVAKLEREREALLKEAEKDAHRHRRSSKHSGVGHSPKTRSADSPDKEQKAAAEAAEAKKAKGGKGGKKGAAASKPRAPSPKKDEQSPEKEKSKTPSPEKDHKPEVKDAEIREEDIIPVAKEAIIGAVPANPELKIQNITDVKILDGLVRAYVLIAEIVGRSCPQYTDYLIMAHAYLMKLWQVTVTMSGATMKEILKNPPGGVDHKEAGGKDAGGGGGGKKGKDKDKGQKSAPVKDKPKRKGPLDALPHSLEDWANYDVPDEVLEAFKHDMMVETGINKHTFVKPMLSLHYIDSLIRQLREIGYNHLTLPVLAFEDMLARDLLQNNSLKFLIHTRALEVCLELNLVSGCTFHEKALGVVTINEMDQAKSRDDIAMWKEKQAQVIKEEMRVREQITKMTADTKHTATRGGFSRNTTNNQKKPEEKMESHLGKVLGAVQFRDVWTDTAEVLIRQGHYQVARDFLMEAHSAGTSFKDISLQARALYLLGTLSYEEAQYGLAVNYCKKAQSLYHGDEIFWYETTMLMADATLHDYEGRNSKRIARGILLHALNEFLRIQDERPNRCSTMGYVISMIEGRLANTQWSIILEEHHDINNPMVMKRVHGICDKYDESINQLIRFGYKREALPLMRQHADILKKMAEDSVEAEIKHTYYLQAMLVLKDAVCNADDVLNDIQTLYSIQEIRCMSLPIQREAADVKIACGELLLEIFRVHAHEARSRQLQDQRKGSVLKMVEDFIRATPDYTHMEKDWVETVKVVLDEALVKFLDGHNLGGSINRLKAKSLCGIGQCLRALAFYKSPDAPTHWVVNEMELAKLSSIAEEDESQAEEELDKHSRQFLKYSKQIREIKTADSVSRHYLIQATELLVQTLILSLNKKYVDVAAVAAQELVECFGQFDPVISTQFLALYQSCYTSLRMNKLLHKAQPDPIQSKLAALLRQRENMLARDVTYNSCNSTLMNAVQSTLESDWQAWKKMEIMPNHLDILKDLPANFNFVILQHSPDMRFLYAAILDKPKAAVGVADKKGGHPKQAAPELDQDKDGRCATNKAKIVWMPTSRAELEALLTKCHDHCSNVGQVLVKQEYQRSQAAMRRKMLENLDDDMKDSKPKSMINESEREEQELQDEFRDLVMSLEMYLKPITQQLDGHIVPQATSPSTSTVDKPPAKDTKEPPQPASEFVVLLADAELLQLPLESVKAFQADTITSVTRDFSLQMFHHRYFQDSPQVESATVNAKKGDAPKSGTAPKSGKGPANDDAAAKAKAAKAKGGDQPFSRIPGMRDASKKMAKIIPLSRPGHPWNISVDTMNFRFIVDPHVDCAETEENKPIEVFNRVLEEYEQQFTPRWLGVMGNEHAPSVGEWEIYLTENSSFIFYGMEKFLSYIPPAKLSALNIPECMMVYTLDMAQTTNSFTRQSKIDVLKSPTTLSLERPVETAMLTSLAGVKCVLGNQWHCTLAENASKLKSTMKDLLDGGLSTGECLQLLFAPHRRKQPPSGESEMLREPEPTEATAEDDDAKSDSDTSNTTKPNVTAEVIDQQRAWFNLVCYGLPNLIVAQL